MNKKKSTYGGAGRGQGRKSREELGLERTVTINTSVEPSVIEACRRIYGSIPAALRFAAKEGEKKKLE